MAILTRPRWSTPTLSHRLVVVKETARPSCHSATCGSPLVDLDPLLCELVSLDTVVVTVFVDFVCNLLKFSLHLLLLCFFSAKQHLQLLNHFVFLVYVV